MSEMDKISFTIVLIFIAAGIIAILIPVLYFLIRSNNKKMGTCKVCNKEVARSASKCPHCSARLSMHPFVGCLIWLIIIPVVFFGVYILGFFIFLE